MSDSSYPLWSDEPSVRDLLSFDAVAATVADTVLDDKLDPIALGLSGSWGSGKTSVLELVKADLRGTVEKWPVKSARNSDAALALRPHGRPQGEPHRRGA